MQSRLFASYLLDIVFEIMRRKSGNINGKDVSFSHILIENRKFYTGRALLSPPLLSSSFVSLALSTFAFSFSLLSV